ncbi:MAG: hypothetical protein ABFS56_20955 [Pseudomonadota bacterium]
MTISLVNDLSDDNMRRRHLTIFFFVAAIVLAVLLNWGQLFAPEIWPFLLIIGFFLVVLLRFCLVKLETHYCSLHELDKALSPEKFSQLHHKLRKKGTEQFIADNLYIFKGVLNKSMPFFVQQRLNDVILRLERCQGNFENSFHLMNSRSVPIAEETSWRFIGQFFVNTLLFIGIIGTFHGLIIAFSDDKIITLLSHYGDQSLFNEKLKEVFAGFSEAFGSSLIAYISYIFGRVMLEMVDADHDALGQFLEQRLMGDFVTIFPKPLPRVELPEEVKIIFEKSAESLDKLIHTQEDLVDKFDKTVRRYQNVSDRILNALLEGRKAWKNAAETWQNTTEQFIGQSSAFISNLDDLRSNIDKLIVANDKFIETWEVQMGELNQALTDQYKKYTGSLTQLEQQMLEHVNTFEQTRLLVTDLANQVINGQTVLLDVAKEVTEEERKSRQLYTGQIQGVLEQNTQQAQKISGVLQAQQSQLIMIHKAIQQLEGILMGQEGTPDDLLSVLRDLRDFCGVNLKEVQGGL